MKSSREFLEAHGLPGGDPAAAPTSARRFPDGGQYRIEIPTTEGPRASTPCLRRRTQRKVPVHRVSQGSGIMLMTDDEIAEMLAIGRKAAIEVNLFIGPRATFDIGAQAYSAAGQDAGARSRGADQLVFGMEDLKRAVELGLRSVLVSDIGILQMVGEDAAHGRRPAARI